MPPDRQLDPLPRRADAEALADAEVVLVCERALHDAPRAPSAANVRSDPAPSRSWQPRRSWGIDAADRLVGAEDAPGALSDAADRLDARLATRARAAHRRRQRAGSVVCGDDVVRAHHLLDRVAERASAALAEYGHERDQREADHQRGGGDGGAGGLRTEFWRASRPAAPPMRAAGHASTDGERLDEPGRDQRDADEQDEAPDREQEQHPADGETGREHAEREQADAGRDRRAGGVGRVRGERRPRERPSRTAEIGGTLVARSAGKRPATSVIRMPTSRETTTVRVATTRVDLRQILPERGEERAQRPWRARGRGRARARRRPRR